MRTVCLNSIAIVSALIISGCLPRDAKPRSGDDENDDAPRSGRVPADDLVDYFIPGEAAPLPGLKPNLHRQAASLLGVPWRDEILEVASATDEPGSEKEGDTTDSATIDGIEWRSVPERGFFMARSIQAHAPSSVMLSPVDEAKLAARAELMWSEMASFEGELTAEVRSLVSEEHEREAGLIADSRVRVADRTHFTYSWNGAVLVDHKAYLGFETDGSLSKVRFTHPKVFAVSPVRERLEPVEVQKELELALSSSYLGDGDPERQLSAKPVWTVDGGVLRPAVEVTGMAFAGEGARWTSFMLFLDEQGGTRGLENL